MESQVSFPRGPNSRREGLKGDKRVFRKGPSRGRSLSPSSRGRDEAQLAGSRSATRILPAGALSPTAEHRRSLSRASSRREKSRERAVNAEFAAEAMASARSVSVQFPPQKFNSLKEGECDQFFQMEAYVYAIAARKAAEDAADRRVVAELHRVIDAILRDGPVVLHADIWPLLGWVGN